MLVPLLIGSRAQGAWPKVGRAAAAEAHGGHVHNTCRRSGISPSTWRASVRATWGANLGHFQAESVLGQKMKFVHLGLLYISCLRSQVIRALDQRVIRLQVNSVNVLTAMNKNPN